MSYSVEDVTVVERIAIKINLCKVLSQTTTDFQKAALKLQWQMRCSRDSSELWQKEQRGVLNDFILCDNLLVKIIRLTSLYCQNLVQLSTETTWWIRFLSSHEYNRGPKWCFCVVLKGETWTIISIQFWGGYWVKSWF